MAHDPDVKVLMTDDSTPTDHPGFAVFGGDRYYPRGGGLDLKFRTPWRTIASGYARGFVAGSSLTWAHVVDLETWEVVETYESTPG